MSTNDNEPMKYSVNRSDDYVTGWNDCYAAIEADRQRRGEPVAWPKTAAEIRDFIDVHYISMAGDDDPSDGDKYLVTAHDLLSAFSWWTDFYPQPAAPVVKDSLTVAEPVKQAGGALRDFLDSAKESGIERLDLAHIYDAPVKVPSDAEVASLALRHESHGEKWPDAEYRFREVDLVSFARALLERYGQK